MPMRMTNNAIEMANGLTLTMDDTGTTVNGLALLNQQGEPMGIETSTVVARQGIFDRDVDLAAVDAFLDTDGDIVTSRSIYIAPAGASGSDRKAAGARIVFDGATESLRFDVPGRQGAITVSRTGSVTFPAGEPQVVQTSVSAGGFFDREGGVAPGAKIDVDGGSAHVGGGVYVCPAGTAAALRAQVGVEASAANDALVMRAGGQIGATVRSTGLAAPSVSVGAAESAVVTADATSIRVAVNGTADALVATADRVVGPAFADRETETAAGAKIDVDGGSAHVGGGVYVCPAGTAAALRAQVGVEASAANDALVMCAGGQAVAEVTAAGDLGATRVLFGEARNGALAADATSVSMEVNADPTSRLTLRAGGIQVGGIDSGPFRVIPAGTELERFSYPIEFVSGVGAIGPLYRDTTWSGLYSFEGSAYWDHVDGADPMVMWSADKELKSSTGHFRVEKYRVKIAIDSPSNKVWVFGGPAESVASGTMSEPLVVGERYRIPFTFNAATGDVQGSVVRESTGQTIVSISSQVGTWWTNTALYLYLCNDNDVSTNLSGIDDLRVLAGVPHVAFRYPVLFLPPSANSPIAGIVPGSGLGIQTIQDRYEPGTFLVTQFASQLDFDRWNAWADAQVNLSLAPGSTYQSYPVIGGVTETTAAVAVSTLVDAPFWAVFTPVTPGGTGSMAGTSFGDDVGFYSRADLSRVAQHAMPDIGDFERSTQNGTRVLLLLLNTGVNKEFTSVDRNGYVSEVRSNGGAMWCLACMYLSEAGNSDIHWCNSLLGATPGDVVETVLGA